MYEKAQAYLSHRYSEATVLDRESFSNYGFKTSSEAKYQFTKKDKLAVLKDNFVYELGAETKDANMQVHVIGIEWPKNIFNDFEHFYRSLSRISRGLSSAQLASSYFSNALLLSSEIDYRRGYLFSNQMRELMRLAKHGKVFDLPTVLPAHLLRPEVTPWHVNQIESTSSTSEYSETSAEETWAEILDQELAIERRIEMLLEAHESDPHRACSLVIEQLLTTTDSCWRDELVLFTENMQLTDVQDRCVITSKLLEVAEVHAFESVVLDEQVLYSALRTAGSMITLDKVGQFETFLQPPKNVDTHTITFSALVNIYEIEVGAVAPHSLMLRVNELVETYLSSNMIIPGENAARLCMAIQALAAIGSSYIAEAMDRVVELDQPWLQSEVIGLLIDLKSSWIETKDDSKIGTEKLARLQKVIENHL